MPNSISIEMKLPEGFYEKIRSIISEELSRRSQPEPEKKYISRKELKAKTGLSYPSIIRYTKEGKFKGYRIGKRVLYLEAEIDQAFTEIETLKYKKS
jgi:predicted DNA-binding transcriptional regulator AlpA